LQGIAAGKLEGQNVEKHTLFWIYFFYPLVALIRLAQIAFALLDFWFTTGTCPYLESIQSLIVVFLYQEVFGWWKYFVSYCSISLVGLLSTVIASWMPLLAHFWIGYDPGDCKFAWMIPSLPSHYWDPHNINCFSPAMCSHQNLEFRQYDVRFLLLSSYCLYPWFNYLSSGSTACYYVMNTKALNLGYSKLYQPTNFLLDYLKLRPPDGFILGIILFLFMLMAHLWIIIKASLIIVKHLPRTIHNQRWPSTWICLPGNILNSSSRLYHHLRGSLKTTIPRYTALATFVYNASEVVNSVSFSFDSDSVNVVLDNSANTHIWNNLDDFVEGTVTYLTDSDQNIGVVTIGDTECRPIATGTVLLTITDENNHDCKVTLKDALYFPTSPVNVLGITKLGEQLDDEEGTWIKTRWRRSTFAWDHEQHQLSFNHPASKLPVINVKVGFSGFASFCTLFEKAQAVPVLTPLQTCRAALPSDTIEGLCFVTDSSAPQSEEFNAHHFPPVTPVQQTFSFGDKLRLTYNGGVAQNVEVVAANFDAESSAWEYDVILLDGSVLTVRKEFLSPIDEPDLVEIPITLDEVQAHIDKLDPATVEALLNPAAQSDKISDFLGWHIRAGHLPFKDMATLSDHGYLPPHFKKIAQSKKVVCPSCVFGKGHRKPWRTKGKPGSIRQEEVIELQLITSSLHRMD